MDYLNMLQGQPPQTEEPGSLLYSLIANQQQPQPLKRVRDVQSAPTGGSLWELLYGPNVPGHADHLHVAGQKMGKLGRYLQGLGFDVGENPKFGGVAPVHTDNSYHYTGHALDVNYGGGGRWDDEASALSWLKNWIANNWR